MGHEKTKLGRGARNAEPWFFFLLLVGCEPPQSENSQYKRVRPVAAHRMYKAV